MNVKRPPIMCLYVLVCSGYVALPILLSFVLVGPDPWAGQGGAGGGM